MAPPKRIVLPAVAAAASLIVSGCSANSFESGSAASSVESYTAVEGDAAGAEDTVYCVDENNVVVDEKLCDDTRTHSGGSGIGTALLFFMVGRYAGGILPGSKIDPSAATSRFQSTDQAARKAAGLAPTGPIKNGYSAKTGKPAALSKSRSSSSSEKNKTQSGKSSGFGGGKVGG